MFIYIPLPIYRRLSGSIERNINKSEKNMGGIFS